MNNKLFFKEIYTIICILIKMYKIVDITVKRKFVYENRNSGTML